jgi:hypothetical protein
MHNNKNPFERRRYTRFKPKEDSFAAVLKPDCNKLGPIKDISKGGLSFQYITSEEQTSGAVEVAIFSNESDFYLKLPAKIVVDFVVDNRISFSSIPIRQLNLKFAKMRENQEILLDSFIRKYFH